MEYHVIHEDELSRHPDLAALVQDIDRQHPPVGYERLLYPWLFIVPQQNTYTRLIRNETNHRIIPLLPVDETTYSHLKDFSRATGEDILLVDTYHEWLARRGLRMVPVGVLQNIDLREFHLHGTPMRKLRYLVNRFANSGIARTVEYGVDAPLPLHAMRDLMEAWGKAKHNVIWHTALCMEHLLNGELPAGHRAFLTYLGDRLCSIIVIEACGESGYLMDQEFYDPANAPLGHMEFAIVQMMEQLKREDCHVFSLGATWYPFALEDHPQTDPEGWSWLKQCRERPTLLGKIFEQGRTNYHFKKKFGVAGEPLFAYLAPGIPFSTVIDYWSVFYENSLTPSQLSERLRAAAPVASAISQKLDGQEERQAIWDQTERFETIPYSANPLDLMTDSWFGSESEGVRRRTEHLKSQRLVHSPVLQEIFPFKHLFFAQRGRDAEALFYGQHPKGKRKILTTIPWTSTLGHQLANGFEVVELPTPAALDPQSDHLFKGECDLEALTAQLAKEAASVAMVGLELLSNGTGGHPVRLSHVHQLKSVLNEYGIPLVLDASRIVRNAMLLQRYDPDCRNREVWSLVRDLLASADYVVTSLTKDFAVPVGGLIATNDDALAERIWAAQADQDSPAADGELLIRQSLAERDTILTLVEEQLALAKSLQDQLTECRVPIFGPSFGHAIVIDCASYIAEPTSKPAREEFLRDLFIETGVRAGIHQSGQQRQSRLSRGIRLAFPLGLTRAHEELIFGRLRAFFGAYRTGSMPRPQYAHPRAPKAATAPPALNSKGAFRKNDTATEDSPTPNLMDSAAPAAGSSPSPGDIAIIGLSGRFPEADNHYEFWAGLQRGRNFVQEVPAKRWNHHEIYDPTLPKSFVPHKTRCQFGAFLQDYDSFDAAFFNLSAADVVMMDPQERLAMEVVWACLEDAGYTPERLGHDVGLFSGITYNEYQKLIPRTTHSCFLTSRLAYFFNLNGPAAALDTGCASSMAAIDAACQNLRDRRCQAAVVIGANVILHPDHYASLSPELSTTTRPESTPFGESDGWIPAEGVVALLLKPLTAAVCDRDSIYAIIKGSAVGQEGKTSWFSAPSPRSQAAFLQRSFEQAGISPATISYVEAAANGSSLGDAIELEGLTTAFRKWTPQKQCCPVGTVKANVGHGEGVSTLLQLVKVLLQFKAEEIYPLLHPEGLNSNLHLEETPFRFPAVTEAWDRPTFQHEGRLFSVPRRATISSFGGGGNMGHLILEEAPTYRHRAESLPAYLIPVSARTPEQLSKTVAELAAFFDRIEALDAQWVETYRLLNVMQTLWEGRVAFARRVAFVVNDLSELQTQCQRFLRHEPDSGIIVESSDATNAGLDVAQCITSQTWHELGRHWVSGANVAWGTFFVEKKARRVPLPTYCFDKQRYEISEAAFWRSCAGAELALAQATHEPAEPARPLTPSLSPCGGEGARRAGEGEPRFPAPLYSRQEFEFAHRVGRGTLPGGPIPPVASLTASDAMLVQIVKAAFGKALSLEPDTLELGRPLDQYGFDSAMVVGVAAELEKHFQRVPQTLFFECGTIGEVVEYFRGALPATKRTAEVSTGHAALPATKPPTSALDVDVLAEGILTRRLTANQVLEQLR